MEDKQYRGSKRKKKFEEISFDQTQPQEVDLEEAVLGALLLEREGLDGVIKDFSENLFYKEANRLIARAIIEMYHGNEAIDILTMTQKLKKKEELEKVGGAYYVTTLTNRVASAVNLPFHIKLLQQYSLRRGVINVCGKGVQKGFDEQSDIFDVYAELQADLDQSLKEVINHEVSDIRKIHLENIEESKRVLKSGEKSGVISGLKMLDNLTSGWQKSDLIILAGRPAMGKTAMAISMVIHPSIDKGVPVAVFSLEMSNAQLGGRIQSNLSYIDVSKIIKKQLTASDIAYLEKSCEKLLTAPLYIDDTPNISLIELKAKTRRLVREKQVKLIVIDYLQLMRSGLNINNREQEIAEISRGLKGLAKELQIPIVALSQLSRLVEGRADKKPQLSDLRESGQIEQDADMVMFCYRPEYYEINDYEIEGNNIDTRGLFMLIIAKHRNGELGEVPLKFVHQLTKVTNHPNWVTEEEESPKTQYTQPPETVNGIGSLEPNKSFFNETSINGDTETVNLKEGDNLPF